MCVGWGGGGGLKSILRGQNNHHPEFLTGEFFKINLLERMLPLLITIRTRIQLSHRDGLRKYKKKGKKKVQGVTQSQTAALPRPQEEEETDKSKQAQIEQTYEKH